ncbi:transcription factor 25 [Fopius arisanus]|uniref:TCF25_0 protein n=1 Tax=Fopius arisanus TaxID=64838 RepID=A0A0C9QYB2_9HYME|nr:PREDICTED: transcription factor 25 [Fopius arisanus]
MSTRYLRKVYGGSVISKQDHEETSDNEPIVSDKKPKQFNMFNLLNGDFDSDTREEDDENIDPELSPDSSNPCPMKPKRKKKKKKKDRSKLEDVSREESQDEIDEIDRSVREVNKLLGEPVAGSSKIDQKPAVKTKNSIMSIEHKYLNPHNELKRICGSKILPGDQNKARGRGRTNHLRKTWLTTIPDWFPVSKAGLSMTIDRTEDSSDGLQYFVFTHSSAYRNVQDKFLLAVENPNPEAIINIINANPCHVDSLLQFSDISKFNEDLQMAAELVERAVHCLECAFHPLFNLTTGNCRLNYNNQTNRPFFLALFKHLTFIGGRACYRTSLELSKALLSLDPVGDPMAVVLSIDFYALRAKEYEWFIDFCNLWNVERNLTQLPNIAYSLALAHFRIDDKESCREKADKLLQDALFMFPGVLLELLDKCGVSTDTRVLGHDYFGCRANSSTSPALEKLQTLYVVRTFRLWKEADILPWLESNVTAVMDRIDAGDDYAKFCETKRSVRYQGQPPRNILRHIVLSDLKEVSVVQNASQSQTHVFSHDPYPPMNSIDIYPRAGTRRQQSQDDGLNTNLFALFVSSLFRDLERHVRNPEPHVNQEEERGHPEEFD